MIAKTNNFTNRESNLQNSQMSQTNTVNTESNLQNNNERNIIQSIIHKYIKKFNENSLKRVIQSLPEHFQQSFNHFAPLTTDGTIFFMNHHNNFNYNINSNNNTFLNRNEYNNDLNYETKIKNNALNVNIVQNENVFLSTRERKIEENVTYPSIPSNSTNSSNQIFIKGEDQNFNSINIKSNQVLNSESTQDSINITSNILPQKEIKHNSSADENLKEALSQGHHDFIAGTIGGMAGIIAGQPFDTVKTRIQTSPDYSPNIIKSGSRIIREEGFMALYKGMLSPLLGVGLINAIVFGVYGNYLKIKQTSNGWENESDIPYRTIFMGGCLGGLVNCAIVGPVELLKIQMQIDSGSNPNLKYKSVRECIKLHIKGGGIMSLFKGMHATIWREVPSYGLYFVTFEYLRRYWGNNQASIFVAGGMGGVIAWIASYPFDVVKSRIQALPPRPEPGWDKYQGMMHCTTKIYKNEGGKVFWRGLSACLIRSFPMNAITFLVVHECYEWLERLGI